MRTFKHLAILLACFGLLAPLAGPAQSLPHDYSDNLMDSFSFVDTTNWTDDYGYCPLTFTNLASVTGDGTAVLIANTNGSCLEYPLVLQDGSWTNLTLAEGTVMFWVFLTNSASADGWNLDAGQWGTFLEAGSFTPDASYGWWALYTDGSNILFTAQGNDGSHTNYLCAPLNWSPGSNAWTHMALTYATNATQLFINGSLVAAGPGMSVVPNTGVISNSFCLGSSGTSNQLYAAFDDVCFYNCPVDAGTIAGTYGMYSIIFTGGPVPVAAPDCSFVSAPSVPSYTPAFNAVTGPGYLTPVGTNATGCVTSANVWITNVVAKLATNGSMTVTFTIAGGSAGLAYDVFANSVLDFSSNTNLAWAWMGQGCHCVTYTLTNLPDKSVFLILGTPQNTDNDGLTDAYERLVSKTDPNNPDSICAGIPDWWVWLYFGSLNESATNLDSQGVNTLLYDYTNGLGPNVITFTVSATNRYVNQSAAPMQLTVLAGTPAAYVVLLNDTNPADATWLPYPGTNITVNLGPTDAVYNVSVGLRGLPQFAQQTWQTVQLTKDTVGPMLVVTSPTVSVTAQPTIQLQGYTTKPLSGVNYDISNALTVVSNQTGFVKAEYFDPARFAFTTNWIQCYDIGLTSGLNTITVRVTDWAGNTTTTNVNITLDFSTATNPLVQILWPQDGSQVCAGSFTCRGTLDDPSDVVTAQITDTNGDFNIGVGVVERNGNFWLEDLPLSSGPNTLTITVTNAAGLGMATNLSLAQGALTLAVSPVPQEQLWQPSVNLTGTVSDPSCTLSVNGVPAVNNGDGTWSALNVPSSPGGVASFDLVAQSGGTMQGLNRLDSFDPADQSGGTAFVNNTNLDKPAQIVVTSYVNNWTNIFTPTSGTGSGRQPLTLGVSAHSETFGLLWQEDIGTTAYDTAVFGPSESCTTNFTWPADEYILNVRTPSSNGVASDTCSMSTNQVGPPTILPEHCALATNGVVFGGTNSYSRTAQAVLTLVTGGKAQLNQQRLFRISGSVLAITNPATLAGYSMAPSQIKMGELGFLGADSNLWCALQDNDTKTITPRVLGTLTPDYYRFSASQTKYRLRILVNGTTPLAADRVVPTANYCVGQYMSFSAIWIPGLPGTPNQSVQWGFDGSYVNDHTNSVPRGSMPNSSENYFLNTNRLAFATATNWWVSGGTNWPGSQYSGTASDSLTFSNGQSVIIASQGWFNMYRPRLMNWTQTGQVIVTNYMLTQEIIQVGTPDENNAMGFNIYVPSAYSGVAGFTQVYDDQSSPNNNGSNVLDVAEMYPGAITINPTNNWSVDTLSFNDTPSEGSSGNSYVSLVLQFRDYLRFKPLIGGGPNIYVTLGKVTWNVNATSALTNGAWVFNPGSPVIPSFVESQESPYWTNAAASHGVH